MDNDYSNLHTLLPTVEYTAIRVRFKYSNRHGFHNDELILVAGQWVPLGTDDWVYTEAVPKNLQAVILSYKILSSPNTEGEN